MHYKAWTYQIDTPERQRVPGRIAWALSFSALNNGQEIRKRYPVTCTGCTAKYLPASSTAWTSASTSALVL
jgi:hypothetical protein